MRELANGITQMRNANPAEIMVLAHTATMEFFDF